MSNLKVKSTFLSFVFIFSIINSSQISSADIGGKNSTQSPCVTKGNATAIASSTKNAIKTIYCAPPISTPVITSISPNTGTTSGGTPITISGTSFATGATVTMGSGYCTSLTFINSNSISCVTPGGSSGWANVTITNPDGGTYTLFSGFNYVTSCTTVTYSLVNASVTKSAAELLTNTTNTRLAQIKKSCEQDLINNLVSSQSGIYWIGSNQDVTTGSWNWYDGTVFSDVNGQSVNSQYKNWYYTEPNDFTSGIAYGDACAVVAGGNTIFALGQWYDIPCSATTGYIIETGTR